MTQTFESWADAMKLALDALEQCITFIPPEHDGSDFEAECPDCWAFRDATNAITALRQAIAQPSQARELSDEEIDSIRCSACGTDGNGLPQSTDNEMVTWHKVRHVRGFARAIIAAINTKESK